MLHDEAWQRPGGSLPLRAARGTVGAATGRSQHPARREGGMPRWARQVAAHPARPCLRLAECVLLTHCCWGVLKLLQGEIVDLYIPRKWCVPAQPGSQRAPALGSRGAGALPAAWGAIPCSTAAVTREISRGGAALGKVLRGVRSQWLLSHRGWVAPPGRAPPPPLSPVPLPACPPSLIPLSHLQLLDQQADHRQGPRQRAAQHRPPG